MEILHAYPPWWHHVPFLDAYRQGRYEAAYREALAFRSRELPWDPMGRAATLGQLGREEEARAAVQELLDIRPGIARDPRRYLNCFILQDELVDHVIEGLEKAGLQRRDVALIR